MGAGNVWRMMGKENEKMENELTAHRIEKMAKDISEIIIEKGLSEGEMVLLLKIVKWKSAEMMGKNQLTAKTDDEDLDSVIEGTGMFTAALDLYEHIKNLDRSQAQGALEMTKILYGVYR